MNCPKCDGVSSTINVRNRTSTVVYRRRTCTCGHSWETIEVEHSVYAQMKTARARARAMVKIITTALGDDK